MSVFESYREFVNDREAAGWQWHFLTFAIIVSVAIWLDIPLVMEYLAALDYTTVFGGYTLPEVLIALLQGAIIGIIGKKVSDSGDSYHKFLTNTFDSKEDTWMAQVVIMGVVGLGIGLILPDQINKVAEFVTLQTLSLVGLVGYVLIHLDNNWKLKNEIIVLLACLILFFAPIWL